MDKAREPDSTGEPSKNKVSGTKAKEHGAGDTMRNTGATLTDLPPELRVMIAEYVFADSSELHWQWTDNLTFLKRGTFETLKRMNKLEELTALCRVSPQFYEDTADLMWKQNMFSFGWFSAIPGLHFPMYWRNDETVELAVNIFLENAPLRVLCYLRNLGLYVDANPTKAEGCMWIHGLIPKLVQRLPNVTRIKITLYCWRLDSSLNFHNLDKFIAYGRGLLVCLQNMENAGPERKWRFHPYLGVAKGVNFERDLPEADVEEELKPIDLEEVLGWIEHGI